MLAPNPAGLQCDPAAARPQAQTWGGELEPGQGTAHSPKAPVSCLYTGGRPPDPLTGVQVRDAIAQYLPGSAGSGNEALLGRQDLTK